MSEDHLLHLLDSKFNFDTSTLLRDMSLIALLSANPEDTLKRFTVKSLTHCKDSKYSSPGNPEHELLVVQVVDTEQSDSQPLLLILERTASEEQRDSRRKNKTLSDEGDSNAVMDSIIRILRELPHSSISSFLQMFPSSRPARSSEPEETSIRLLDRTEPESPRPGPSPVRLPILDAASLIAAKAAFSSSQSSLPVYVVHNRFVGGKLSEFYAPMFHNIQQILPDSLSLFDFVILENTVHDHDPDYTLFSRQCFWFVSVVCNVVIKDYNCTFTTGKCHSSSAVDPSLPSNSYLPDDAGRWKSMLISRVDPSVTAEVSSSFRERLHEKYNEVC
jgi:hypothetical protein